MPQIYLCTMGANLAPETNFAKAREQIARYGRAHYSRAIYTRPVAMESDLDFLNALFLLETDLDSDALKLHFNAIEIDLGRDRTDPLSSQKDRPMDIDILGNLMHKDIWQLVPSYLKPVISTLKPMANSLQQQLDFQHE
ncbi:2-amino-4-hydroxy-6-hydroxymethyldihydropteridine diphosphokinase [Pseudidiomarina gelatinasegens]|uniref:2-amino-4-hydroxy-6-hydroxymethyldihydropteridine pyrophosphokinase n=1 Tax=Pseudidiomarina gelatinasegens TaxID=2487740 RepID=A0A443Z4Q3_9GAMM|nr:2-amino-4-hydroxy-6-hydroxymethyldihydropteridine diphosphokinase [Pseudidiomarina gelatinasegens]RWU11604.1 2-amino-4-hydroxy-6-hydroxymethyldihydropteridine diphosphokinase [Pseudidiomarina gelatinasegens]